MINAVQVPFQDDEDVESAVTLMRNGSLITIWMENADGECTAEFNEAEFNRMVHETRQLMGWASDGPMADFRPYVPGKG